MVPPPPLPPPIPALPPLPHPPILALLSYFFCLPLRFPLPLLHVLLPAISPAASSAPPIYNLLVCSLPDLLPTLRRTTPLRLLFFLPTSLFLYPAFLLTLAFSLQLTPLLLPSPPSASRGLLPALPLVFPSYPPFLLFLLYIPYLGLIFLPITLSAVTKCLQKYKFSIDFIFTNASQGYRFLG
jgi:hypothetical protein